MIGCNQVMVQERNQMIKGISASQHYLNTTPAPQPTYVPTKPQATGTCSLQYYKTHPEIDKAATAFIYIYDKSCCTHKSAHFWTPSDAHRRRKYENKRGIHRAGIRKNSPTITTNSPTVIENRNRKDFNATRTTQSSYGGVSDDTSF